VGGTVAPTSVYIRLSSSASGSPSGNVNVTSIGVQAQSLAASGTVSMPTNGGVAAAVSTVICTGLTTSISLSGSSGTIQWEQSSDGIAGWTDVTGGSGGSTSNYTTAALLSPMYYRAELTGGACATSYSNTIGITLLNNWIGGTSGTWENAANWCGGVPLATTDVVIPDEVTVTIQSALSNPALCRNLTIQTGGVLILADNSALTANGSFTNESDSSGLIIGNGASLIESTTGVIGSYSCSFTGPRWHFISSPVSDAYSAIFDGKYMQVLNENTQSYSDVISTEIPLIPAQGFALWTPEEGFTTIYSGILNTGNISINTSADSYSSPNGGFNLIGNPYPCSLDWTLCGKTNLNDAVYIEKQGQWATYINGVGLNGGSNYIAPGQGFIVQATNAGSFSVNNSAKAHSTATYFKDSQVIPDLLKLRISGNGFSDETAIRFSDDATEFFDGGFDALKLFSDIPQIPNIYTLGENRLSVNTLPRTEIVPLCVKAGVQGSYTISAIEMNELPFVALEDAKTGVFTELSLSPYTFEYLPGEDEPRFKLHFSALTVQDPEDSDVIIYSSHHYAIINLSNAKKGNIFIYNLAGQLVTTIPSASGMNKVQLPNPGYYLVKVVEGKTTVVKKILID
jgi:hypothetical protein